MSSTAVPCIIAADSIDYTSVDEVCGYQMLLCKLFEQAGGLAIPVVTNRTIVAIQREGACWLRHVEQLIERILEGTAARFTLADLPMLLSSYDIFHRVSHGEPCHDYLRRVRLRVADLYTRGACDITQSQVALMLRREADRDILTLDQRYIRFSGSVMSGWISDLEMYGRLRRVQPADTYSVLAYLLTADLFAYLPEGSGQLRWIRTATLTDEQLAAADTRTLLAYIAFDQATARHTGRTPEEQTASYLHLVAHLASRPGLHPFIRQTIALELARHTAA